MNGAPWSLNNASFAWLVSFLSERGGNRAGAHGVGVVSPAPNLTGKGTEPQQSPLSLSSGDSAALLKLRPPVSPH